ncbi:transketolase [Mesorhizobium sp. M2A.F.Ca.ET.037.01.1.1]|uniref:transketolase family protein n=1 Tax=unclassified Mesorhizobium TaxID=325217 RepID=UPI000F762CB6|nr:MULTISPECIES: transketolase C-terminal domain-containing protein [unclassified Mesorhizobium]RUY09791.1 transketolase [Mesorhizobium sp. M2A.F.Ca.ET.040.01.1.1]AZO16089.1 transketolase [Mesorhizobium sp. M2A.F.Ca.ET.043.05.1.1]RUX22430.1 transketolase [Mesorhizobium sp. M2A.F.Ca.ET.037.01.1.1]RWA89256.1 MAG: transketolase [Mesorhizobium sp.]RWE82436.1 MAG: transketolase [Mesorhizobium sp.]
MSAVLHPDSWQYRELNNRAPSLATLANTLIELAEAGHPVVAGTADLQHSNGLVGFAQRFPARFTQFGISEQNMVSAAAGMATTGVIPYVATFASFLALLCCEQIRMDVAYCAQPVRLIGHHTGISLGFYGTSHHATEDIAIMRSIADLTVVSTADGPQFAAALRASVNHPQPIYFRISRGHDPVVYAGDEPFEFGKAVVHGIGSDLTFIACGMAVHSAKQAMESLNGKGHSVGLIDMHTIKPLDRVVLMQAARKSRIILTVEEHNILGGLGGAVAEVLAEEGGGARLVRHGIKDEYSLIAPPTHLYRHYKLDAAGVESVAQSLLA